MNENVLNPALKNFLFAEPRCLTSQVGEEMDSSGKARPVFGPAGALDLFQLRRGWGFTNLVSSKSNAGTTYSPALMQLANFGYVYNMSRLVRPNSGAPRDFGPVVLHAPNFNDGGRRSAEMLAAAKKEAPELAPYLLSGEEFEQLVPGVDFLGARGMQPAQVVVCLMNTVPSPENAGIFTLDAAANRSSSPRSPSAAAQREADAWNPSSPSSSSSQEDVPF